jgi:hypothetical protein
VDRVVRLLDLPFPAPEGVNVDQHREHAGDVFSFFVRGGAAVC